MKFMLLSYETKEEFEARTDEAEKDSYWAAWSAYFASMDGAGVLANPGNILQSGSAAQTVRRSGRSHGSIRAGRSATERILGRLRVRHRAGAGMGRPLPRLGSRSGRGAAGLVTASTPEERYAGIARQMVAQDPEVSTDPASAIKRFGMSGGLKIGGKLFAFLAKGRLIVKLPKERVDSLIAEGRGEPCEMGRGRVMKEWVVAGPDFQADWHEFAVESKRFVSALARERR